MSFELIPGDSTSMSQKAVRLLACCERCLIVIQINGYDMSLRRVMESKCTQCGGNINMPDEVLEMLILYGHFIPEPVAAAIILGTTLTEPSLRPDFIASAMNELLTPLQTDHVYDVVVPKRREGLGMSLRMYCKCS